MEVASNNPKKLTIRDNWNMEVIESNLKDIIKNCEIWGDLDLSIDEYENIKRRIVDVLGYQTTASGIKNLFRKYPITMVSDIINFVLFEYDNKDFWSSWANRFKTTLSANNQTEIGIMVRDIFKRHNFKIIEDGGYTYVTPILCQAGIPCTCFNKIFDILDSTLNIPYFSTREMIDELRGYRSYLIDAPVERYFRLHTERAIELIEGLREMMHSLRTTLYFDNDSLPHFTGIETRIIKQYFEWRTETKSRTYKNRKNEQYFNSPKLVYDTCKGICLFLPGQVLRQDSIYKLKWIITYDDGESITEYSQVYNIDDRNCTYEKTVPVNFSGYYRIELFDADDNDKILTNEWNISGINDDNPILAFNELGALMSQRFISRKGTIIVFDKTQTNILAKQGVQEFLDIDLPKSWSNVRAFKAYPAEKKAFITFNTHNQNIEIECKQNFDIEFVQAGTLFDERFSAWHIPVFEKFPIVEISGDLDDIDMSIFDNWQVSIIHRLSSTKHTITLSEIGVSQYYDCIRFSLGNYASEYYEDLYGPYEIKIYDGKARRDLIFYMSPAIEYAGIVKNISEEASEFRQKAGFYFKNLDTVEVIFENDVKVISMPTRGIGWNYVFTEGKGAFINGQIRFECNGNKCTIPFKKTIRNLQWQFWNETQNQLEEYGVKLFYDQELKENNWRLSIHFTDSSEINNICKIVLELSSGEFLQSKELAIDREGNCTLNMNLFQDTIVSNKLPQRLMLYLSNAYDNLPPICLAIIRNFVELRNPKFTVSKEQPIILWDIGNELSGKKLRLVSLNDPEIETLEYSLDNIKIFKGKEDTKYEGIIIDKVLPNGVYRIDAIEKEDVFFLEDNIKDTLCFFDKERLLYVKGKRLLGEFLKKDRPTLYECLSVVVVSLCKKEWINEIVPKIKKQVENQRINFDNRKCTSLLFFLLLATNEKSNLNVEIKGMVLEICQIINLWCITDYDRTEILKQLLEANIGDIDCRLIIDELQLYLFKSDETHFFNRKSMQRLWELNDNIAVLANIRKCTKDTGTDLLRVTNHINEEALEKIIKFYPNNNCKTSEWLNCFENVLSSKCRCDKTRFECSKRLWGDGFEWSKLFTRVRNEYVLIPPDESHTDGYEIMNTNYLSLIYTLIINKDDELASAEKKAMQDEYKVENLMYKYNPLFSDINLVLKKRMGDGAAGTHKIFYLISVAAMLEALASIKRIDQFDLLELLPFWKNVMKAYPELVYRDLILSELSVICRN